MVLTHIVQMENSGGCNNARIEPEESVVDSTAENQNTVIATMNRLL